MIIPQTFANLFARTLDLFRDPAAKEDQKLQFRALVDLLRLGNVTIAMVGGRVVINGASVDGPASTALAQRLEFHSVSEIQISAGPPPGEMFELLRALAGQPQEGDIPTRLRAAGGGGGAQRITVTIQAPLNVEPPKAQAPAKLDLGTEGIVHGHDDVGSMPIAPPPPFPSAPPADV